MSRRAGLVGVVILVAVGCGSKEENNSGTNNGTIGGENSGGVVGMTRVSDLGFEWAFPTSRAAALEDDLVVAGNVGNLGLVRVARLTAELEVVWAVDVQGMTTLTSVDADSEGRIVLMAQQGFEPGVIVRLNGDGTLDRAVIADGAALRDLVALPNGGLMLNDSVQVNGDFSIVSRGNTSGERIAPMGDGYVYLSAMDLGLQGRLSGATVRKTDATGMVQWQSFASPGAANYSAIGVRELPDGTVLAAVSGDTNPGHTLVVARFDADGAHLGTTQPVFARPSDQAPLQFGSGIDMLADGSSTYVSFVANSGQLGADARTQITAKLGADGEITGAMFLGGGLARLGESLFVANTSGKIVQTGTLTAECVDSPSVGGGAIDAQLEFKTADEARKTTTTYEFADHPVTVTPTTMTAALECS